MAGTLRERVVRAIELLGTGLVQCPENAALQRRICDGTLLPRAFGRQLTCVVYRLLVLSIAEDRRLLQTEPCSVARLRRLAVRGTDHPGVTLWRDIGEMIRSIGGVSGAPRPGLPRFGTFLWLPSESTPDVDGTTLGDDRFLGVVRTLFAIDPMQGGREVSRHITEIAALGAVYESLLGLDLRIEADSGVCELRPAVSRERKAFGAFYTPAPLVQELLRSALVPVMEHRLTRARAGAAGVFEQEAEELALLGLRVCDPSCGCGNILIAAARLLAERLAALRAHPSAPTDGTRQHAMRDVAERCLFGVDIDPMAVDICRASLWLESAQPDTPMPRLAEHIRVGDALLGATEAAIVEGVPDEAMVCLEGDAPGAVAYYRARNRRERKSERRGPARTERRARAPNAEHARAAPAAVREAADAWCAAFFWHKHDTDSVGAVDGCPGLWDAVTTATIRAIRQDPASVRADVREEIRRLAVQHRFVHWHLDFPAVFSGAGGGFDVVLGNPPFLNQLEDATVRDRGAAALLRVVSGGAVRGYTDISAAFLLLAARLCAAGGRVALVQPQSLLAARDAARVRAALLARGSLAAVWVANEHVFAGANVLTCVPTFEMGGERRRTLSRSMSGRFTPLPEIRIDNDALAKSETWAHLIAAAVGVPEFAFEADGMIGTHARATADFRDEYYGLKGFLVEDDELAGRARSPDTAYPPVVTSGLIDLAACRWGGRSTRLHRSTWQAPRVDRERMRREGSLGAWIDQRLQPKIILATQTKVMEVFVDERGRYLPSTPLISVVPRVGDRIWHVAAALASPVVTAIALQRYLGAGLSANAIKLSAGQVLRLPAPSDGHAWNRAAVLFERVHSVQGPDRAELLSAFAVESVNAYSLAPGDAERVIGWWTGRLAREDRAGRVSSPSTNS